MGAPLRVLVVEDSEDDTEILIRELTRGGYDVRFWRVETREAMAAALGEETWDIVISDYSLPRFSAPDALTVMKDSNLDLPFILVSGAVGEELAIPVLRSGAHDYVTKDRLARLVPAVQRELREQEERQRRREAEDIIRQRERFYRSLIENAHDGILITNEDGVIQYISPSVHRVIGREKDLRTDRNLLDFVIPKVRPRLNQAAANLVGGAEAHTEQVELILMDSSGSERVIEAVGSAFRDDANALRIIWNLRDITARKHAERALQASEARLRIASLALSRAEQQERQLLAADLHDGLCQVLALIILRLQVGLKATNLDAVRGVLGEVRELVGQALRDARALIFGLSPPALFDSGLKSAIEQLAGQMQSAHGTTVTVSSSAPVGRLSEEAEVAVFRAVRELLINVSKHGRAREAWVSLHPSLAVLEIEVSDKGVGFRPEEMLSQEEPTSGYGLFSVRERLAFIGGDLQIVSEPGQGTRAVVSVPLQPAESEGLGRRGVEESKGKADTEEIL